jgi:phosphoglycerate dehydrogenase-like enzyme
MSATRPKGLYLLGAGMRDLIYGPDEQRHIAERVELVAPPQTAETIAGNRRLLADVETIFSGWGMAALDAEFLRDAPRLKVVFYGAGSVRGFVTEESWRRGIVVSSAWGANAVPVAEYTLAAILFCLKHAFAYAAAVRREGHYPARWPVPGAYRSTVGLVSLGMIGRLVRERLRSHDLRVVAYDPLVAPGEAARLGVELLPLDRLFREADVVSLHTPWLKETETLIRGKHLAALKPGAAFINTARGAVVNQDEMIAVLQRRPDLSAVLDVTWPEPPPAGSPLYTLPNVFLTPHIAGSMDAECRRMGRYMVEELDRYLAGQPLQWLVTRERAATMA